MKIALTYNVEDKTVGQHFGDTENFLIVDLDTNDEKIIDNGGYSHKELIPYLASFDVKVLICGGIGDMAVYLLGQAGIKVFCGVQGDTKEAIKLYKENKLTSDETMIHQCSCHH